MVKNIKVLLKRKQLFIKKLLVKEAQFMTEMVLSLLRQLKNMIFGSTLISHSMKIKLLIFFQKHLKNLKHTFQINSHIKIIMFH